ncbi:hypothetical protein MHI48_20995 [Paenibacillus sp. FSL H7-0942]|uniref:hypothetical protein n=1 Tax=Paenibacillus TaxID=44249 RepID=UPI00096EF391|nr:hypothetical protein [Paenibacillus amylolyticus]OMF06415.1 hypothetical protein BK129_12145 [Paenibacillus amylolyticus]
MSVTSEILEELRYTVTHYKRNLREAESKENILTGWLSLESKDKSVLYNIKNERYIKETLENRAEQHYNEAHRLFDRHKDDFEPNELKEAEALMNKLEEFSN